MRSVWVILEKDRVLFINAGGGVIWKKIIIKRKVYLKDSQGWRALYKIEERGRGLVRISLIRWKGLSGI